MCDVRSSHDNKPTTPSILEVTSLNLEGKKRWGNAPRLLRISDLIFAFLPSELPAFFFFFGQSTQIQL